jgi:NAD(P)-dependent dehydrogenase (short-subunit alcohol dehydrogenase family)
MFSLTDRVAIVTGGSRGLGKEIAWGLAEAGARVAITARRAQWLEPAAAELAAGGRECFADLCDVSDVGQVDTFVRRVLDRFGQVDVLVNNAGISWGSPSLEMPAVRWREVLDVNISGAFFMSRAVARHIIARGPNAPPEASDGCTGKIVNISSIMGLRGMPPDVVSAAGYSASKGALVALTRALAVEWAPYGITVNAIAPGFFPTRLSEGIINQHEDALLARIPLGRFGSDRDIRGVAVFLASAASDYLTGQVIALDGGATAW